MLFFERQHFPSLLLMGGALVFSLFIFAQVRAQTTCSGLTVGKPYKHAQSNSVYYISDDCTKRPIKNADVFFSYFRSWNDVQTVAKSHIDNIPDNALGFLPWGPNRFFKNGSLLKTVSDSKVYLLINYTRYPIADESVFRRLQYAFSWVEDVDPRRLSSYTLGNEIATQADYPGNFVFKYEGSPRVYVLERDGSTQTKRYITSFTDLDRDYRANHIATLPSGQIIRDSSRGNIPAGTDLKKIGDGITTPAPEKTEPQENSTENNTETISRETTNSSEQNQTNNSTNTCGNGTVETTEGCDTGISYRNISCKSDCSGFNAYTQSPDTQYCGNGELDPYEACDHTWGPSGSCTNQCTAVNGRSAFQESSNQTPAAVCGNGQKESGEACDDGASNGNAGQCNTRCSGRIPSANVVLPTLPPVGTPTVQWTTFAPSANTNIIYVSSNGDDSTGQVYAASQVGSDPFNPTGSIKPYATLAVAMNQARDGMPDWVLFKRGDTFYTDTWIRPRSGQSHSAMSLIGSYGSGPRPVIIPSVEGISMIDSSPGLSHAAFMDLDFYGERHDPHSSAFTGYSTNMVGGVLMLAGQGNTNTNILFENNRFRYLGGAFNLQAFKGTFTNVTLRGNSILHSYAHTGHAGGAYMREINGLLLEGNVFDHNGWLKQSLKSDSAQAEGQGTIFNHNLYLDAVHNTTLRNNAFLRASSIGVKVRSENAAESSNVVFEDNLFVEGEVGISFGGNDRSALQKFDTVSVRDNVFMHIGRARPTNRYLSWAVTFDGLFGGPNVVDGNIFMLQEESNLTGNAFAILANIANEQTSITNNVFYNYYSDSGTIALYQNTGNSQITFSGNDIQSPGHGSKLISYASGPYTFSANRYYSKSALTHWFVDHADSSPVGQSAWAGVSGEVNSQFAQANYPNPNVRLESYVSNKGMGSTYTDFINVMRAQERAGWNANFEPSIINDYIRAGFGR